MYYESVQNRKSMLDYQQPSISQLNIYLRVDSIYVLCLSEFKRNSLLPVVGIKCYCATLRGVIGLFEIRFGIEILQNNTPCMLQVSVNIHYTFQTMLKNSHSGQERTSLYTPKFRYLLRFWRVSFEGDFDCVFPP